MSKEAKKQRGNRNRLVVDAGAYPPSVQVKHFTPTQWEEFVETCCALDCGAGKKYCRVKRMGGPGDAGRDVEARYVDALIENEWDLYQAKHYKDALAPSDLFPELAKFFRHLANGTYPRPRYYYVCAPANTGADLHDLLANPTAMKQRFLADWKAEQTGLQGKSKWLTQEVLNVVQAFDFSAINEILLRDLLRIHEQDEAAHYKAFNIVAARGDDPSVPALPTSQEQQYIEQLIKVYSEKNSVQLTVEDVLASPEFAEHFEACRAEFYCAEGLRRFSRDIFPEEFERLLAMVHQGIRSAVVHPKHTTGFDRYDAAMDRANALKLSDSKLHQSLRGGDLPGACHHLVNEGRIKWVP